MMFHHSSLPRRRALQRAERPSSERDEVYAPFASAQGGASERSDALPLHQRRNVRGLHPILQILVHNPTPLDSGFRRNDMGGL